MACSVAATAAAAPPATTSLFPSGAQRGATTTLKLVGKAGTAPVSAWCSVPGASASVAEKGESLELTLPPEAAPGLHWLRLFNAEGATASLPLMVGVLPEIEETEPNNTPRDAASPATLPTVVNGVLHKSQEVDLIAVELQRGQTLVASIDGNRALGKPLDPVLQLLSPDGFVVEQCDDHHGTDPQIVYTADRDGVHHVRVFAFPADPNSTINFAGGADYIYRLTLTTGPFVDHQTASVRDGASKLSPHGWNLPKESAVAADLPGLHHLHPPLPEGSSEAASASGQPEAIELPLPLEANGRIAAPGHAAAVQFAATKGETLRIVVLAQTLGSALDPVVTIRNAKGESLKETDDIGRDNRDVDFTWKAPEEGKYRVEFADRFGHGGLRYYWRLSVGKETPRVEASLAADRFLLKRKETLEIPVTVDRAAGFAEKLTFRVEGLPEGVEQEPGVSEPKGDTSKKAIIKLKSADAAAFNGPVRVTGGVDSDQAATVSAAAKSHLPQHPIRDIWLTIEAPPAEK